MTQAPIQPIPTTLEQCDECFLRGVFLIKDAVLGYAQLGLNARQIGERVRGLGADLSDRSARRYISTFRAAGLLPEKELSQNPSSIRSRKAYEGVRNGQSGQTGQVEAVTPAVEVVEAVPAAPVQLLVDAADIQHVDDSHLPEGERRFASDPGTAQLDRWAAQFVLRDYGRWDDQMGFFPDPAFTLITKHLHELDRQELLDLRERIDALLG